VRVNPVDGPLAEADLDLAAGLRLDALVVPHATVDAIDAVAPLGLPTVAVVESARGLREAYEIATRPHVVGIQLGAKDLALDLGLEPRADALELLHARSRLVVDAVAAGLEGLWDRVAPAGDHAALEADAAFGRSLGFRGKSTLAPEDARVINRVFAR
jgi:citrate lyase subunit beta/citryl-CoA lyase